jgi:hypothetical protein
MEDVIIIIIKNGVLTIENFELEKAIKKVNRIAKEKYDTLKTRTNRKLRIKVKKPIQKVNKEDNEL